MRTRTTLAFMPPRREPRYGNALSLTAARNQLNPLQFSHLFGHLVEPGSGTNVSGPMPAWRRLLNAFVPWVGQKFPRTGQ